jgi:hypothetical protein
MSAVTVIVHDRPAAGAGQAPQATVAASAGRQGCARHGWLCAYIGSEPGRCPRCHSTWDAIAAPSNPPGLGCGTRAAHQALHDRLDARRAKDNAARAALRTRTGR